VIMKYGDSVTAAIVWEIQGIIMTHARAHTHNPVYNVDSQK